MNPNQLLVLGVPGPELTPADAALYRELQPGGFVLFTRNIVNARQTRKLTDDLRDLCDSPPLICIDNEGGRVWRTAPFCPPAPSPDRLRQAADRDLIGTAGFLTGQLLRLLGFNLNLAPVLDIDWHPGADNALRGRCWGRDDQEVINNAGTFNRYQRRQGILGCGKHFPAGGHAMVDAHHELPFVTSTIDEMLRADLLPYSSLMPELDGIMISHIHFPRIDADELPASLSRNVITGLLRDQLGLDHHAVFTDDLDMNAIQNHYGTPAAARLAVLAGADLLLLCHEFARARETLDELETLSSTALCGALERIDRLKARSVAPRPLDNNSLQSAIDGLTELQEKTPGRDQPGASPQSPVEDY
jgi:beta-N-acetylhexosaminidase